MKINVDALRAVGVTVTASSDGLDYSLRNDTTIELEFRGGVFPEELHAAIRKLMPDQQAEADIIGEHTFRKINDFLMVKAINDTAEGK